MGNRLGALALRLSDQIRDETEAAAGVGGGVPAALVSLREWANGTSVDTLARVMRVSHSRAVRVVDDLEAAGWARREPDPLDARRVRVWLEDTGRDAADRALEARSRLLDSVISELGAAEMTHLERVLDSLLDATTVDAGIATETCRLCDAHACGHFGGTCPVTRAADRLRADS